MGIWAMAEAYEAEFQEKKYKSQSKKWSKKLFKKKLKAGGELDGKLGKVMNDIEDLDICYDPCGNSCKKAYATVNAYVTGENRRRKPKSFTYMSRIVRQPDWYSTIVWFHEVSHIAVYTKDISYSR